MINKTSSSGRTRIVGNGIATNTSSGTTSRKMNSVLKRPEGIAENIPTEEIFKRLPSPHPTRNGTLNFHNARSMATIASDQVYESSTKSRYYGSRVKNYQAPSHVKENAANNYDYKFSSSSTVGSASGFVNQSSSRVSPKDNHRTIPSCQYSRSSQRNENAALTMTRKTLGRQNIVHEVSSINCPPSRGASQSIIDGRRPFIAQSRAKYCEPSVIKSTTDVNTVRSGRKELGYAGQSFHGYDASTIAGIASIQNLGNVGTANITPYVRSDSYGPPTVANVLFPETGQYPQSPPFNASQVGQLNQYQTYATTSVNVNSVMAQYSPESAITFPQYESQPPQFVQTNHYTANEITTNQYQYQTAGVRQIQESPLFLQSLQNPIAVTEQYAASSYPRSVRTELLPCLRRPPRLTSKRDFV